MKKEKQCMTYLYNTVIPWLLAFPCHMTLCTALESYCKQLSRSDMYCGFFFCFFFQKCCDECKKLYCAACAQKVPSQTSIRRCQRCNVLVNGTFNRSDLSNYKVTIDSIDLSFSLLKKELKVAVYFKIWK